ncbi:MAG: ubiquinol-cytochrome c reductase iron-sulfur subunit [Burkholderiales bacterium]
MSDPKSVDQTRRNLVVGTAAASGLAGVTAAWPFVDSMNPSERAKALGAPVEADISNLKPGQLLTVEWQGKPVWILKRTPAMNESVKKADAVVVDPDVKTGKQPADLKGKKLRAQKDDIFVAVGICSHLGCSPKFQPDQEMFFCPCHGSKFDLAGRVYKNVPAPTNLVVPPHVYVSDTLILIGTDKKEA